MKPVNGNMLLGNEYEKLARDKQKFKNDMQVQKMMNMNVNDVIERKQAKLTKSIQELENFIAVTKHHVILENES